jgi:glutathione S-transferase
MLPALELNGRLITESDHFLIALEQVFGSLKQGMESRPTYHGTQTDFHTHTHDLPPQMGGCWENGEPKMLLNKNRVNNDLWIGLPDVAYPEPESSRAEALIRVIKHRANKLVYI